MRPEAPVRPAPPPRPQHSKPDANPLRLLVGLAGIASVSALVTAMLPSVSPTEMVIAADTTDTTVMTAVVAVAPEPSVVHVTRYVTLQPGQTAPPQSSVLVKPQPTPHVTVKIIKKVQVVTKQSGKP
jgi:hypothetical protein